jgi:hypothetical protein
LGAGDFAATLGAGDAATFTVAVVLAPAVRLAAAPVSFAGTAIGVVLVGSLAAATLGATGGDGGAVTGAGGGGGGEATGGGGGSTSGGVTVPSANTVWLRGRGSTGSTRSTVTGTRGLTAPLTSRLPAAMVSRMNGSPKDPCLLVDEGYTPWTSHVPTFHTKMPSILYCGPPPCTAQAVRLLYRSRLYCL